MNLLHRFNTKYRINWLRLIISTTSLILTISWFFYIVSLGINPIKAIIITIFLGSAFIIVGLSIFMIGLLLFEYLVEER